MRIAMDIDLPDPYRPDATTDERADHVIGVLLADEDPARRYRTIQTLQDGRLRDAAAISLRQLRDTLGTTEAAAAAVGVSRQAANELLAKAGAPGARQDRLARDQPAYQYGRYLATVRRIAETIPTPAARDRATDRWTRLEAQATQTLGVLPAVAEAAQAWLKSIRVRWQAGAGALAAELDEVGVPVAEWVAAHEGPELSVQEQAEVWLGYHHERVRVRQSRGAGVPG
ncbi:hypothetical protein [Micromonospora wenchangensis]|uniref:hypothetical protein n=1 Tax=Micromonospora wenchangensis TaxID=1185415 RepID=UPI00381039A7